MKKTFLILLLVSILLIPMVVFGADALYRLMHNNQDALVIGEITKVNDNSLEFKVKKSIISGKDLNENSKLKQLDIDEFKLGNKELIRLHFFDNVENENEKEFFKEGDFYLISLNKKMTGYEIAWGMYKLSSSDYKTLDVLYGKNPSQWEIMEAMAIKEFVNSDGQENQFSFHGKDNTLKSGDRIIYDGNATKVQDEDINIEAIGDIEVEDIEVEDTEVEEELIINDYILAAIGIGITIILIFKNKGRTRT